MTTLWLDLESYSAIDLRTAGTHRYAEEAEIIIAQWAMGNEAPRVLDCTVDDWRDEQLLAALHDPKVTVVAHNSAFDRTLLRHCWGIDVPIERWRDTMVQAMVHGLPGALGTLGPIVGLDDAHWKDARGNRLIKLFCSPRPVNMKLRRATRETHPKEWAEFLEYSRQDIVAMRELHAKLPTWNYQGQVLAQWHLDQRINDRGFAVDLALAEAAIRATNEEQRSLRATMHEATLGEVSGASKRDDLLAHILNVYGVTLPDMRADTLRRRLDDPELPAPVRELLAIRLEATKTSTAKYRALVNATSSDGRLRNTLQFAGAQRTMRWAGRIFQPQNLPRSPDWFDGAEQENAVAALKAGHADVLYPSVMEITAYAVRGCIVAPAGRKLVVSDLSNIEGRALAWLAGEQWKLQAFKDFDAGSGHDLYKLAYARSFNVEPTDVGKPQRQIGKVMELGLGYEGGVAAFLTFAAVYQMDLSQLADAVHASAPPDVLAQARDRYKWAKEQGRHAGLDAHVYTACQSLVTMWRDAHASVRALWRAADDAVRQAIAQPGETIAAGKWIKVRRDGAWLRVRLPSGRYVCYLHCTVDEDGTLGYMGVNQYTRQWDRLTTYGGKLVENWTQALARDVLAHNMPTIEAAGYDIVLTVHDEVLTETPDEPQYNVAHLSQLMATVPPWAPGLPLAAAGFESYRYKKD